MRHSGMVWLLLLVIPGCQYSRTGFCESDADCMTGMICNFEDRCAPKRVPVVAKPFGGSSSSDTAEVRGVSIDNEGNILLVGEFSGHVEFGDMKRDTAMGAYNAFLVKVDPMGNVLWVNFPTPSPQGGSAYGRAVAVDAVNQSDNVVMIGYFSGMVDFGQGMMKSNGDDDVFVAEYAPDGKTTLWSRTFGGDGSDHGYGVTTDGKGGVYMTGYFENIVKPDEFKLTSHGSKDIFMTKLASQNGMIQWSYRYGEDGDDRGYAVSVDQDNHVYFGGGFTDKIISPEKDMRKYECIRKYFSEYNLDGSLYTEPTFWNSPVGFTCDWSSGPSEIGWILSAADRFGYITEAGTTTYTENGSEFSNVSWLQLLAPAKPDGSSLLMGDQIINGTYNGWASSITVDGSANIAITGTLNGITDQGYPKQAHDTFIAKYSPAGTLLWDEVFSGTSESTSITIGKDDSVIIAGGFSGTVGFGTTPLTSKGGQDVFVLRLPP